LAEALEECLQGIALLEQNDATQATQDLAQAYNLQGIIYRNAGNPEQAIVAHERSIILYQALNYLPGLDRAYTNLACVYQDIGRWAETRDYFQRSQMLSEQTGEVRRQAAAAINLAEIEYLKGDLTQAMAAGEEARRIAETYGFAEYRGVALINLGKTHLKRGELSQAGDFLEESLTICRQLRSDVYQPEILRRLAELHLAHGQAADALPHAQESLRLAQQSGHEVGQGQRVLGQVYRKLGKLGMAESHLTHSLALLEAQGNRYETGLTLVDLARLRLAQATVDDNENGRTEARELSEQAIRIFGQLEASLDLKLAQEIGRSIAGE
jgi:tetratricopeptide (TPR) repeat protein